MSETDRLTERDWLISLLTTDQEQLLTDYEVHPDAWKGDPDRTDGIAALADGILDGLAHRRASQAAPVHEDDLAVDRFAAVMKAKLAKKRDDGRGGWSGPECSEETLSRMLRDHVGKGDPVDVANFAMMLHQRGERIAQAAPAPSDGLREVGVRPLEWDASTRGMWSGQPSVKLGSLAFWVFLSDLGFEYISKGKKQSYPTLEDAKAAAQADYEARIRAALSSPAQEGGGE